MDWLAKPHADDVALLAKLGLDPETASMRQLVESARHVSDGEVAWLARFHGDQRVFAVISGDEDFFDQDEGDSVPLRDTYCVRMVKGEIPNAIPDARRHPATRDLRGAANDPIGSYVGVPVRLPNGDLYGSLCSVSRAARPISPETVRLFSVLAGQAGQRLMAGNVRSEGEIESADREIKS
jgi:GAF domain-containing protein